MLCAVALQSSEMPLQKPWSCRPAESYFFIFAFVQVSKDWLLWTSLIRYFPITTPACDLSDLPVGLALAFDSVKAAPLEQLPGGFRGQQAAGVTLHQLWQDGCIGAGPGIHRHQVQGGEVGEDQLCWGFLPACQAEIH